MLYNQPESDLLTLEGNELVQVDNFKYLGAWIQSSEKDMSIRIGQSWSPLKNGESLEIEPTKSSKNRFLSCQCRKSTALGAES